MKHEKSVSNRLPRVKLSPEKITKLMFRRWFFVSEEVSDECSKNQLRCEVDWKVKQEKLVSDELIMIEITTKKDYEADVSIVSPSYLTKAYCLKRQLRWEVGGK